MALTIKRAVITAAGPDQRRLPLQTLTDRTGTQSTVIQILVDEILDAGIERIALVLAPGDRKDYEAVLGEDDARIEYIEQHSPMGYGHAVLQAKDFAGGEPFLLQVSDHIYLSRRQESCTRQIIDIARATDCTVSAVQATHESQLPFYGTIGGTVVPNRKGVFQVEKIIEKPTPTVAEQECVVPGLRHGYYLCFFGMHVLRPTIFEVLEEKQRAHDGKPFGLSDALNKIAATEKYLATQLDGRRANLEERFGFLRAQIALGLHGDNREEVLALMLEELAARSPETDRQQPAQP